MFKEGLRMKGQWTIQIRENGRLVRVYEMDNQLTNAYRDSVLNQLFGDTFISLDILYLAVGTGAEPAQATDTQLEAEIYRGIPTQKTKHDGYVQTIWVIPTTLANTTLREIGVFAGDATTEQDSGTMLSRMNINIEKTSSMEITFIRRDYVTI